MIFPVYEYLLWDNCNNNCQFCYQKFFGSRKSNLERLRSIDLVSSDLNRLLLENQKFNVLLVGGEIFDDLDFSLADSLKRLFLKILDLLTLNLIDYFYINTNLIYEGLDLLYWLIGRVAEKGLLDRFKFTTSYDVNGRYESDLKILLFRRNLIGVSNDFPKMKIVVNQILTKSLCELILDSRGTYVDLYVQSFKNRNVDVNLLPYVNLNSSLAPTRELVINSLLEVSRISKDWFNRYLSNLNLDQDKIIYKCRSDDLLFCSAKKKKCNHVENFSRYAKDNDSCFICDINRVFCYV